MAIRWCFTLNNPTEAELMTFQQHIDQMNQNIQSETVHFTYLIYGKEHWNEGEGTPHLQGFFKLKKQKQLSWIKRHIPGLQRAHLEVARGSDSQAREYCTKEGAFTEAGTYRQAAEKKRSPWDDIKEMIEAGADVSQIRSEYPAQFMSRQAGITQWVLEVQAQLHPEPWDGDLKAKNVWVWGPPGTGKSRWAHSLPGIKYMKLANKWWDGFNGQQVVLMEDLDPTRCQALAQHLKIWADRYPFTAEVKGGHRPIRPEYQFIITSNYHPDSCFATTEDQDAIKRRFSIFKLDFPGAVPAWPPSNHEEPPDWLDDEDFTPLEPEEDSIE